MWENSKQPDPAGGPNTGGQLWSLLIAFNTRQRRGAREGRVRISRSGKGGKALDRWPWHLTMSSRGSFTWCSSRNLRDAVALNICQAIREPDSD